jgi:hypothetical protein
MSAKIHTAFNNFSRGVADHDLNGRYDLPIYQTSSEIFQNFYGNFKGNALFRCGFEIMTALYDCATIEFKFNKAQSYICVFYNLKVKFLTYDANGVFGFVETSPGVDLEVTTPYSLAESKELDWAQNADVMYLTHPSHAPRKLTRTSATNFTVATFSRTADPFTGAGDYPSLCAFYGGFLYYAATNDESTTIWRSNGADYDNLTTGTADDDGLKFAIAELTEKLLWLKGGNKSLIGGSSQGLVTINGGQAGDPITPSTVSAFITNTDGASSAKPLRKEDLLFYVNNDQRSLKYFNYDILTESFKTHDASVISHDIGQGKFKRIIYKQDRNDLIWILKENGKMCALNFNEREKIVGWGEHVSEALFKDICSITNNEGIEQLFALVLYSSDYYLVRMAEQPEFSLRENFFTGVNNEIEDDVAFNKYTAETLKSCNYLDLSQQIKNEYTSTITYTGTTTVGSTGTIVSGASDFSAGDVGKFIWYKTATGREWGIFEITAYTSATTVSVTVKQTPTASSYSSWYKTFTTITGLTAFAGDTMSVVADGGYLGDFVVSGGGEISLGKPVTSAWVGFGYEGLIKSFNLGFQLQGLNTQVTVKNMNRVGLRMVNSAGGKIGTSLYRMVDVQEFKTAGFFDLPPLPMDGDVFTPYNDDFNRTKSLYIKQDKPLPFNISAVVAEVNYGTKP